MYRTIKNNPNKPTCSAVCEDDQNKNCFCPKGYRKDGVLCHKQNPCLTNQGGCDQICSFDSAKDTVECSCTEGYNLGLCFKNQMVNIIWAILIHSEFIMIKGLSWNT